MLSRQAAINVAFVSATRRCQLMDATGVAAAAYSITNQVYSLGVVVMLAIQATGATLVPSAIAKSRAAEADGAGADAGLADARRVADRLFGWSIAIAAGLAAAQALAMPHLTQLFTPLPEVREAIRRPAQVSALVQLSNGVVFAGEGVMMGLGAFGYLAGLTAIGVAVMVAGLQISAARNLGVASVWWSLLGFHAVLTVGQLLHHLRLGPLARAKQPATSPELEAEVDCAPVPLVGEVCILSEPEAGDGEEAVEA